MIDLDVHQGDGTAAIFEDDPDVLTVSVHGENNFPFRKQRSRIDIALPDGTGDDEYLAQVARSAAGDGGVPAGDRLLPIGRGRAGRRTAWAGWRSPTQGLQRARSNGVRIRPEHAIPVVVTLGGGYSDRSSAQ